MLIIVHCSVQFTDFLEWHTDVTVGERRKGKGKIRHRQIRRRRRKNPLAAARRNVFRFAIYLCLTALI